MMKNKRIFASIGLTLLLVTSCHDRVGTSLPSTRPPVTPSTTTPLDVKEDQTRTTARPLAPGDAISRDLEIGFTPLIIAEKSLTNSRDEDVTWHQSTSLDFFGAPLRMMEETVITDGVAFYRSASFSSILAKRGEKKNIYRRNDGSYLIAKGGDRSASLCLFNRTTSCDDSLDIVNDDFVYRLDGLTLDRTMGEAFHHIEDLYPINRYTIDERESSLKAKADGTFDVTLKSNTAGMLINMLRRFSIDLSSLDFILEGLNSFGIEIQYNISDDYTLNSIAYSTADSDEKEYFDFSSAVWFSSDLTIVNSAIFESADPNEFYATSPVLDYINETNSNLLIDGLSDLLISNKLPFVIPIDLELSSTSHGEATTLFQIKGELELLLNLSISDVYGFLNAIGTADVEPIARRMLQLSKANLFLDIVSGDASARIEASFDGQVGESHIFDANGSLSDSHFTIDDLVQEIGRLLGQNIGSIHFFNAHGRSSDDPIGELKDYLLSQQDPELLAALTDPLSAYTVHFIDPYLNSRLLSKEQFTQLKNQAGSNCKTHLDGTGDELEERYSWFLNGEDLSFISDIINIDRPTPPLPSTSGTSFEAPSTSPHKLDFTKLKYDLEIANDQSTGYFDHLSFSAKLPCLDSESFAFSFKLGETHFMTSKDLFVTGKYFSQH